MTWATRDLDRLFFGVLPSRPERAATISAANRMRERAGVLEPIRAPLLLHMSAVSACCVPTLTEGLLHQLTAAGDRVIARAFQIYWRRAVRRGSGEGQERALKLIARQGDRDARLLQQSVCVALIEVGIEPISDPLPAPHVTLLYGQGDLSHPIEPVCWTVRDLVLIQSLTGLTEYRVRGRWPLLPPLDGFEQEFDFT